MVQLLCSPAVAERLTRELAAVDVPVDGSGWALVERGHALPSGVPAIVFDALDYMDAVRLVAAGLRDEATGRRLLTGQSGSTFTVIPPKDVVHFEAAADGITAVTATGSYRVRNTLQYYETTWGSIGFIRVNKSQLVNVVHIKQIVPWFNSRYVLRLTGGSELEVSKTYAKRLRSALGI